MVNQWSIFYSILNFIVITHMWVFLCITTKGFKIDNIKFYHISCKFLFLPNWKMDIFLTNTQYLHIKRWTDTFYFSFFFAFFMTSKSFFEKIMRIHGYSYILKKTYNKGMHTYYRFKDVWTYIFPFKINDIFWSKYAKKWNNIKKHVYTYIFYQRWKAGKAATKNKSFNKRKLSCSFHSLL